MSNQASVAYADSRPPAGIWLAGDGLTPDGEAGAKKAGWSSAYEIQPRALQSAATLQDAGRFAVRPPASSATAAIVDERTAEAALQDVLAALGAADAAASRIGDGSAGGKDTSAALRPTIKTLGKITSSLAEFYQGAISMEALQLKLFDLQSSGILDLMSLSFMNQKTLRTVEANLLQRKTATENQAREEQAKLNEKAGKGGVLGVVCAWAMGAAQLVMGAIKIFTGQPLSGAADIGAGLACMTRAVLMTVVYCHPEMREELQDDIDRCAKAEMAFGIISGATSILSAARVVQAGRVIVKAAAALGQAEGKTLGVTLARAINTAEDAAQVAKTATVPAAAKLAALESQSAMAAAQQIASNLGKEVAKSTVEQMQAVLKQLFGNSGLSQRFTKMFGEEAIEKMVSDSLMRAAKTVAGKGYGECVSLIQTEFVKQVEREAMRAVTRAAVQQQALFRLPLTAVAVATTAAVPIVNGAMTIEFAGKQRDINRLLMEALVLNFAIDYMRRSSKAEEEFREDLMEQLKTVTADASKGIREAGESMQQVVGNMA
jgi:secreted effector protein SseC